MRTSRPHPSKGGTTGYDKWYRQEQLARFHNGDDIEVSMASIYRWMQRVDPFRATGNHQAESIRGVEQLLMAIFLFAYPTASEDEISTVLYDATGQLYDRQAVSRRMKELHLTKKKSSTEAYQAFLPHNIQRVNHFFSLPPPLGIVGVRRARWIDVDECGIELTLVNREFGHAHTSIRIQKPGHYTPDVKLTVLMAIEPGDLNLAPQVLVVSPGRVDGSELS
jgi:hypothetical protein